MKRRNFLSWVGVGFLASSLPVALAACQTQEDAASDATSETAKTNTAAPDAVTPPVSSDGFTMLGSVADLDAAGAIANADLDTTVIRNPANPATLIAVNSRCTHEGCAVEWDGTSAFTCPCHDAKFAADGSAISGPTKKALATFEAKIETDQVWVKIS